MHIYFSFKKINKNEIKKMGDGGAIVQGAIVLDPHLNFTPRSKYD